MSTRVVARGYLAIVLIVVVGEAGPPLPVPGDGRPLCVGSPSATGRLSLPRTLVIDAGGVVGAAVLD